MKRYNKEKWKPVKGYNGYFISTHGRVYSFKFVRYLIPAVSRGYRRYVLFCDDKPSSLLAHRLVAIHFIPNPENKPQVNHKNCIKSDNIVSNLEWCTAYENTKHAIINGIHGEIIRGSRHHKTKLTDKDVLMIRESGRTKKFKGVELAKMFNVLPQAISKILRRETWVHI